MNIEIEWFEDESAYIVTQDGLFIGDFATLKFAARFALSIECVGAVVTLVSVETS